MLDQTMDGTIHKKAEVKVATSSDSYKTCIASAARVKLRASAYPSVHNIQCEYHEGVLVLRGRVASYFHKQLAQETVRGVAGVGEIINVVEVMQGASGSSSGISAG